MKYLQVRDLLVERFRKNGYEPGRKLPTELDLTRELGVSRTTVRQALELLEHDGVVRKRHGSGTFFVGHDRILGPEESTGLIGLVNFFFMDYIYPEIIRGIEETIFAKGFSLALANCNLDTNREMESVERLVEQGVKGLILEPSRNLQIREDHPMQKLISRIGIPVVTTHWGISNRRVSTVTLDDLRAGYDAVNYLIGAGHREIGIVYKRDVQAGHDRYMGYCNALTEAGIEVREELVAAYDNEAEAADLRQGYLATRRLMLQHRRPTAIFYFNDHNAIQGYTALQELGISVPEDLSVLGFDNYQTTELLTPPLTTFEHPKYELGRWAANLLLDEMVNREKKLPMKLVFEPTLVERKSVGPPHR
ncbi:MAG: substrate-binding domain-containing protein [Alkalispirochaetaceae bacterium]